MTIFHFNLDAIVRPSTFASSTTSTSKGLPSVSIYRGKLVTTSRKVNPHFFTFIPFSLKRLDSDGSSISEIACWKLLQGNLIAVSDPVRSSTTFALSELHVFMPFIININSHGPNLVPWGTLVKTAFPH